MDAVSSNTPDSNVKLVIKLCRSLITTCRESGSTGPELRSTDGYRNDNIFVKYKTVRRMKNDNMIFIIEHRFPFSS